LEGLSRLVRIPALHAGGHGFKSHSLHFIHEFISFFKKQILMYHDMIEAKRKLDNEFQQFDDKIIKTTLIKNSDNINRSVMNIFFYLFNHNKNKS
jgi:hypothetical protein